MCIRDSIREAPAQEKHGSNGLCPNSVSTRAVEVPKKKAVKKAPLTGASGAF